MTPIKQRNKHDPDNGVYGDCHRAAVASILDLSLDEVPHFMDGLGSDDGDEFNRRQDAFLETLSLTSITVPFAPPAGGLNDLLVVLGNCNPGRLYLVGGESARNCGRTVIAGDGKIVHDPSPEGDGLIGPMKDGLYWITFIGSARATR